MKWQDNAACLDTPPDDFFPDPSDQRGTDKALAVCAGCPVRDRCLELALSTEADGQRHGIFGMTTPQQRTRIAKRAAS